MDRDSKIIYWGLQALGCVVLPLSSATSLPGMVLLGSAVLLSVGLGACLGRFSTLGQQIDAFSKSAVEKAILWIPLTLTLTMKPRGDINSFLQGSPLKNYLKWIFAKLSVESMQQVTQVLLWLNRISLLMGLMNAALLGWRLGAYWVCMDGRPARRPTDPLRAEDGLEVAARVEEGDDLGVGVYQAGGSSGCFARTVLVEDEECLACYRSDGSWLATLPLEKARRVRKKVIAFTVSDDEQRIALLTAIPAHPNSDVGRGRLDRWVLDSGRETRTYKQEKGLEAPHMPTHPPYPRSQRHRLFFYGDSIFLVEWWMSREGHLYRWNWNREEADRLPEEKRLTHPGLEAHAYLDLLDAQVKQDGSFVLLTGERSTAMKSLGMPKAWRTEYSLEGEQKSVERLREFVYSNKGIAAVVLDGGGVSTWDPDRGVASLRWQLNASDPVDSVPSWGPLLNRLDRDYPSHAERELLENYDAIAFAPAGIGFRAEPQIAIGYHYCRGHAADAARVLPINLHTGAIGLEFPLEGVEAGWRIESLQISLDGCLHGTLRRFDHASEGNLTKLLREPIGPRLCKAFPEDVSLGLWVESQRILSVIEDLQEAAPRPSPEEPLPILMLKAVVHENTLLLARRALQGQVAQQVAPVE